MTLQSKERPDEAVGGSREERRAPSLEDAVRLYHFVRQFRYLSDGVRDPAIVYERRAGSCSGKHIVLRDLLRGAGFEADIETIEGDFAERIPRVASFPEDLKALVAEGNILDFHHFVRLHWRGRWLCLDATWPDRLRSYGFPVNSSWNGQGDSELAVRPLRSLGTVEDVQELKRASIAGLPTAQRLRRERFLALLSKWMKDIEE